MAHITPDLSKFERKVFSQFGEDGVIERLASDLGIERGTFFEFGIGPSDGKSSDTQLEGNFVLLREKGWHGVFLDCGDWSVYGVERAFITALNVNTYYRHHNIPDDLDFMSIDVDGQDFWIWMSLQARPKVIVVEYNGGLPKEASLSVQFDVTQEWDGSIYQGASLLAFDKLAKSKQYTLVYANGTNAFFIRDDLVSNPEAFSFDRLYRPSPAPHPRDTKERAWIVI